MRRTSSDAEYLEDGTVTVDADGIPVTLSGKADKTYVDQVVPIRILTGQGTPEGRVTAPVGSIYTDSAATNGAIRWVKASGTGSTGWRVEYGDTGWRNLSSLLPSTWAGEMSITRTQNRVTIIGSNIRPGETGDAHMLELPAGFRPARTTTGVGNESGAYKAIYALNYSPYRLQIRNIAAVNSWLNFSITYVTQDAWPTSLPGTPI